MCRAKGQAWLCIVSAFCLFYLLSRLMFMRENNKFIPFSNVLHSNCPNIRQLRIYLAFCTKTYNTRLVREFPNLWQPKMQLCINIAAEIQIFTSFSSRGRIKQCRTLLYLIITKWNRIRMVFIKNNSSSVYSALYWAGFWFICSLSPFLMSEDHGQHQGCIWSGWSIYTGFCPARL